MSIIYFSDYNIDKSKSIGISCVFSSTASIPSRIYSHKGSWARIIQNQLISIGYKNVKILDNHVDNWNDYDNMIIDHGMEFAGTYNLFSGLNDAVAANLLHFNNYKGVVFSLTHEIPDFVEIVKGRLGNASTSKNVDKIDLDLLAKKIKNYKRFDYVSKFDTYLLGDSHCTSIYEPNNFVHRNDGLTLYGALKKGLSNLFIYNGFDKLKLYFGNIDIRHHLMRQDNPSLALKKLLQNYEQQIQAIPVNSIELSEVLPIEDISRKIPQTGYYNKTPYFGTWEERNELRLQFNSILAEMCENNGWDLYRHPSKYLNDKGQLSFDVMEKPQSVHISREFYRWNFEKNAPNERILN